MVTCGLHISVGLALIGGISIIILLMMCETREVVMPMICKAVISELIIFIFNMPYKFDFSTLGMRVGQGLLN